MNNSSCRLCITNPGEVSIYSITEGIQINKKIVYCCGNVNIEENDGLPTYICNLCECELKNCYDFILKCEESDKKLRSTQLTYFNVECNTKIEIKTETEIDHDSSIDDVTETPYESPTEEIKQEVDDKIKTVRKKKVKLYKKRKSSTISKCNVCGRICPNASTLVIHMRSHTNERPYACSSCEKTYKDSGSLKRHTERTHLKDKRKRNFICENCGKGFFSKNEVKIHMRVHTGETPYACAYCPARFTQISALQRHQFRHTGVKTHKCLTCLKKFCTKDELNSHSAVHSTIKKFVCSICNALFKFKNNLRKHVRSHSEDYKFICNYCGRNFSMKGNLKLHIERLHSSKSGYCDICVKNVSNMEVHMWKHTGERPLKCDLCSSSFSDQNSLARHINFRHKQPDRYKCNVDGCPLKFPSRPMLDFHVAKLHSTVKPFQCDKCSRGFYRKSDLVRHKTGTHKERIID